LVVYKNRAVYTVRGGVKGRNNWMYNYFPYNYIYISIYNYIYIYI